MSDREDQYLNEFPEWLNSLGSDALALLSASRSEQTPIPVRVRLLAGLNYLFRSLDLIPDGIEDLGYLDDALVLRVATDVDTGGVALQDEELLRLRSDVAVVDAFLGDDRVKLRRLVEDLETLRVNGRTAAELVADEAACQEFGAKIQSWAESYEPPVFTKDEKNLVKLRSFLRTKLAA